VTDQHPLLELTRQRLQSHTPLEETDSTARPAAVVILLRPRGDDAEILFIQRAIYESDPWSGQIAFPGGRSEADDVDLFQTALRETREELGVDLSDKIELLGRLDDLHPRTVKLPSVFVRPFVLATREKLDFAPSTEVADFFWLSLKYLRDSASWAETTVEVRGMFRSVRACRFEGYLIWGMTERILSQLLALLD
jgi:8-oxo-dGTP pyrophosphatase MutT (NUDIX family)